MPERRSADHLARADGLRDELCRLWRTIATARAVDQCELELVHSGEAFFHVAGTGHEGLVALAPHLTAHDWLHLHYRDKALLLARGVPPETFFHALLCTADSPSAGRQMSAHLSDPARRVLSMVGPVGNNALQAVGVAAAIRRRVPRAIVVCSVGDGSTQQGEFLEAVAEAVRSQLPVLFVVEDNGYSISTPTAGRTFFSLPPGYDEPSDLFGLPIQRLDGSDVASCCRELGPIVESVRSGRQPALVLLRAERLSDHTNADDQRVYRPAEQLEFLSQTADPLRLLEGYLIAEGVPAEELRAQSALLSVQVRQAAQRALDAPHPLAELTASRPLPPRLQRAAPEYLGQPTAAGLTLLEALRETLRHQLARDDSVVLLGEDIEDPKGDVFGLTRGLSRAFPGRVINSALSESTIVGTAIGRALGGERPVAFIQFADFLPLAMNQLLSELGSLYWRTAGGWECPLIVLVACGGYRPGLGPFHAQTLESILAHTPGIDVLMPSTAGDAAGLLNAAFASRRPTVLFYPKVCLNDRAATTSPDVDRHLVPLGTARRLAAGEHLTLVTWGSTVPLCRAAAAALEHAGRSCDLLDLRSLVPWDLPAVLDSVGRTGRLLVVHEDNLTCGFGAEVVAAVVEAAGRSVVARRVARPDTYVPCHFTNQLEVLPSLRRILTVAAEMLDLELTWSGPAAGSEGLADVEAIGSSPADQVVQVVAWKVRPGQPIAAGEPLAEMEADKAVFEMAAPVSGVVRELLVEPGRGVPLGSVLARIETGASGRPSRARQLTREQPGVPTLRPRGQRAAAAAPAAAVGSSPVTVGLSAVYTAEGSREVTNEELVRDFPGRTADEVFRLTGITSRRRLATGETVLTLATAAARAALAGEGLAPSDLSAILCSSGTAPLVTPSLACLVHHELSRQGPARDLVAYDLSAACTGFLYALAAGYDFIQTHPGANVLVLTAEALSTVTDPHDFDTAVLFGDAATACVLSGGPRGGRVRARLYPPLVSARGESGSAIRVTAPGTGFVEMDGRKVFAEAVRQMLATLQKACAACGVAVEDLDLVVPHQANGRIIDAICSRLGPLAGRVVNQIRHKGNTSSSSIPLCLATLLEQQPPGRRLGLCAFGGGFTFGAAVVETIAPPGE